MYGSEWEGGKVFAFGTRPNKYAIKKSGSHQGIIISFKTKAVFVPDPGIDDPRKKVLSCRGGGTNICMECAVCGVNMMGINEIQIQNEGYIECRSSFYSVQDILTKKIYVFNKGVNILSGAIDSGNFGISYLLSMYKKVDKKNIFLPLEAFVDGEKTTVEKLSKRACYMDLSNPLFSHHRTVKQQIAFNLKRNSKEYTPEDICDIFSISEFRFNQPLKATGNEKYKAMAAIGFCHAKEIFCFPWFSKMRYESFGHHMPQLLEVLSSLNMITILPTE